MKELFRKHKKIIIIIGVVIVLAILGLIFYFVGLPYIYYSNAEKAYESKNYEQAVKYYEKVPGYKDSDTKVEDAKIKMHYELGIEYMQQKEYEKAVKEFKTVIDYEDSKSKIKECGKLLLDNKQYESASNALELILDYDEETNNLYNYAEGLDKLENGKYLEAITLLEKVTGIDETTELIKKANYLQGKSLVEEKNYSEAISYLEKSSDYEDSKNLYDTANFILGEENYNKGYLNTAKAYYNKVSSSFEYDGIKVKDRLAKINKYSSFLKYCGKWETTKKNKYTIRRIGSYSWDEWYNTSKYGTFEVTCKITDKGVKLQGSGEYLLYKDWSSWSEYLDVRFTSTSFNKTVKKLPSNLSVGNHTKLTFSNGKIKLVYNFTDRNESIYSDYRRTANWTYNKRVEKY